jgi:hypothetical protein
VLGADSAGRKRGGVEVTCPVSPLPSTAGARTCSVVFPACTGTRTSRSGKPFSLPVSEENGGRLNTQGVIAVRGENNVHGRLPRFI